MYVDSNPEPPITKRKVPRSLYWPGFVLGMLIASALSCGGLYMATGLSDITLADIRGGEPAWVPPTPVPTIEVAANATSDGTTAGAKDEGAFQIGQSVRNILSRNGLNIRATPGHLGKETGDVLAVIPSGGTMEILDGVREADSLRWWYVRYIVANGTTLEGWVTEATGSGVKSLGE